MAIVSQNTFKENNLPTKSLKEKGQTNVLVVVPLTRVFRIVLLPEAVERSLPLLKQVCRIMGVHFTTMTRVVKKMTEKTMCQKYHPKT